MFKPILRSTLTMTFAVAILGTSMTGGALAADSRDFGAQTCKDVMRLSGSDRDIALAFAHGYRLGRKGTTVYQVEVLADITDRFIDYCLDHPAENALQSFEKIAE